MRPIILFLSAGLILCWGCFKKGPDESDGIREALLEMRSDFRVPGDSLRWLGYLTASPHDTTRAWLMLGVLYLANDHPETSLEYLRRAERRDATRAVVHLNLATAHSRMHNYDLAAESFREFLKRDPQSQLAPEIFRIIQKYRSIESEKLIPGPES